MKIEVGEYVRTNDGLIGKLIRIERDDIDTFLKWYVFYDGKNERYINKPYITKHSKNLIDLVEEGDILEYQLFSKPKVDRVKKYKDGKNGKEILLIEGFKLSNAKILSFTTHEKFEQMKYKVEE